MMAASGGAAWMLVPVDLAVCALGPAALAMRFLRWRGVETLVAGVGFSLFLVYLAGMAIRIAGVSPTWHWAVSAACLVMLVGGFGEVRRWLRDRQARAAAAVFGGVWLWTALLGTTVLNFAGGRWVGDWVEHYERSLFFLRRLPVGHRFIGQYLLPARPPMMNVLGAHAMAIGGARFEAYQLAFAFLNALVVLPCCLLARRFAPAWVRRPWVLGIVLALSPMLVQNVIYPWTKLFADFYVLLGVWLYLEDLHRKDHRRVIAAAAAMAAGVLAHYSAAVYVVAVGGHFLWRGSRHLARPWRATAGAVAVFAVVCATWLGWAVRVYGFRGTFASNTTVRDSAARTVGANAAKIAANLWDTLVPHALAGGAAAFDAEFGRPTGLAWWREYLFLIYQQNAVFMMGSVGGIAAVVLLVRGVRRGGREARFWAWFAGVGVVLGVAVVGVRDVWGLGHICLQPVALAGITLVAARATGLNKAWRRVLVAGWAVDAALGVVLNVWAMSRPLAAGLGMPAPGAPVVFRTPAGESPGMFVVWNWMAKLTRGYSFVGDHFGNARERVLAAAVVCAAGMMLVLARSLLRGPGEDDAMTEAAHQRPRREVR